MIVLDMTGISIGTIIESIQTDMDSGILLALETFELQACIGATQVITESVDPVAIMESAVKDFLDSIIQKLKKFVDWVRSIFDKIKDKFNKSVNKKLAQDLRDCLSGKKKSTDGKTFDENMTQVVADTKNSDGAIKEKALSILGLGNDSKPFRVIDVKTGIPYASKINSILEGTVDGVVSAVEEMCTVDRGAVVKTFKVEGVPIERMNDIIVSIGKQAGHEFSSKEDIIDSVKDEFNCSDKSKGIDASGVKSSLLMPLIETYISGTFMGDVEKTYKYIDKHCNRCIKRLEGYQRELKHSIKLSGSANTVSKLITTHVNFLSATSSLGLSVCNCMLNIIQGGLQSYKALIYAVMNYKSTSNVNESYSYDYEDCLEAAIFEQDNDPAVEGFSAAYVSMESYVMSYT